MKPDRTLWKLALALFLASPVAAQVPAGATPITITQVNTLAGITTWTFTAGGQTYYLQAPAYITLFVPQGPSPVIPLAAPGLWTTAAAPVSTSPTQSPDLTSIASGDGKAIYDANLNKWEVVNQAVYMNGRLAGFTSGVIKLVIVKGVIWQQNSALNWWYWNTTAVTWDGGAAPI